MKKRNRRTDLALEAHQLWQENVEKTTLLSGVQAQEQIRNGLSVSTVRILNQQGSDALGKPPGTYVTITLDEENNILVPKLTNGGESVNKWETAFENTYTHKEPLTPPTGDETPLLMWSILMIPCNF